MMIWRWLKQVEQAGKKGPTVATFCNKAKTQHISLSFIICNYEFFKRAIWMHPVVFWNYTKIGKIFQMVGYMNITTERFKPPITWRSIQACMRWSMQVTWYPMMAQAWSHARQPMESLLMNHNIIFPYCTWIMYLMNDQL